MKLNINHKKIIQSNTFTNQKIKQKFVKLDENNEESNSSETIDSANFYIKTLDPKFINDNNAKSRLKNKKINATFNKKLRKSANIRYATIFCDQTQLSKIPQKILIDDENPIDFLNESKIKIKKLIKYKTESQSKTNRKFYFHVIKSNIENLLINFYLPILSNSKNIDALNFFIYDAINKLNYFFNNESTFTTRKYNNKEIPQLTKLFCNEIRILELINVSLFIFIIQVLYIKKNNNSYQQFNEKEISSLLNNCFLVFKNLYEIIILLLLLDENKEIKKINHNIKKEEYIIINSSISKYILNCKEKLNNNNQIINKLCTIMDDILNNLSNCIKLINTKLSELNNIFNFYNGENVSDSVTINDKNESDLSIEGDSKIDDFIDEAINNCKLETYSKNKINDSNTINNINNNKMRNTISTINSSLNIQYICFNEINNFLNKFYLCNNNINKKIQTKFSLFYLSNIQLNTLTIPLIIYIKLKETITTYFTNFKKSEKEIIPIPFLPPINNEKYKYTLVIDLDETLIHYSEENKFKYISIRPNATKFLEIAGKFFELIIFTAAEEDYADIILNSIDLKKSISHRLYRKHLEYDHKSGNYVKNLASIGRDISKICIVDDDEDNFVLQPDNGIRIRSYFGNKNDMELCKLWKKLKIITEKKYNDIRPIIKEINKQMSS